MGRWYDTLSVPVTPWSQDRFSESIPESTVGRNRQSTTPLLGGPLIGGRKVRRVDFKVLCLVSARQGQHGTGLLTTHIISKQNAVIFIISKQFIEMIDLVCHGRFTYESPSFLIE